MGVIEKSPRSKKRSSKSETWSWVWFWTLIKSFLDWWKVYLKKLLSKSYTLLRKMPRSKNLKVISRKSFILIFVSGWELVKKLKNAGKEIKSRRLPISKSRLDQEKSSKNLTIKKKCPIMVKKFARKIIKRHPDKKSPKSWL